MSKAIQAINKTGQSKEYISWSILVAQSLKSIILSVELSVDTVVSCDDWAKTSVLTEKTKVPNHNKIKRPKVLFNIFFERFNLSFFIIFHIIFFRHKYQYKTNYIANIYIFKKLLIFLPKNIPKPPKKYLIC